MTLRTQNDPYVLVGDIADLPPPATIAQGTIFHADDTSASYVLVIDQVTHARSWQAIVAPGGGLVEPLNQIVEGTGTGVTSSPLLTFDPAAAKFVASDLSDIPIFSVSGTPGARNAIVDDASGRTIWQILANNVSRTIAWVDETGALVMQAASVAASRTVTWFDETGTASILKLTLLAATANVLFGRTSASHLVVDVANAQVLGKTSAGVTTFVLDEATGAISSGTARGNGAGSITLNDDGDPNASVKLYHDVAAADWPIMEALYGGGVHRIYIGGGTIGFSGQSQVQILAGALANPNAVTLTMDPTNGFLCQAATGIPFAVRINNTYQLTITDTAGVVITNSALDMSAATCRPIKENFSDQSGAPGNATANATRGRVAMAIGAKTLTLSNSFILGATSQLKVWIDQAATDTTATAVCARCTGAGAATIGTNANATAATVIGFEVVN